MKISLSHIISLLLALLALLAVIIYTSVYTVVPDEEIMLEEPEAEEIIINYIYDIPADSFRIERGKVRQNQPFSTLLNSLGVPHETINTSLGLASDIFDARRFRAGNNYTVLYTPDSLYQTAYFVYEKDAVEYVVFSFTDSIAVWSGIKDIDTITQVFAGSIQSSLWNAFASQGASPIVAIELSEIYAWTIDFFGLQQGDSFCIVYDEYFVDDIPNGIGKVHGAYFRHMGSDFWAIPFEQDGQVDFYDADGGSLRKAFLKAPLRYSRISSRFSHSRMHPILKIRRPHHGVDYAAPVGTPVLSVGDGVVIKTGYDRGAGNMVRIKHNSTYSTAYLHLSRYGKGIKNGAYVKQGDIIGYVGSSGLSTGPHLDFRFYKNDHPVDPLRVESPPVEPVKEENLERFAMRKTKVMELLNTNTDKNFAQ